MPDPIDGDSPQRFALEPGSLFQVLSPADHPYTERWQPPAHLGRLRPALILLAGEVLVLPPLSVRADTRLRICFAPALPAISSDGLTLEVYARRKGRSQLIYSTEVAPEEAGDEPRSVVFALPRSDGPVELELHCGPGAKHDPCADWLALLELSFGPEHELDLIAARSFRALRLHNECAHFNQAYEHPMYQARRQRVALGIDAFIPSERSRCTPDAVENAFDYALARLCERVAHKAPDFEQRLRERAASAQGRPLRILSVATGLGLTEAALLNRVEHPVELTVVDLNDHLMSAVAANMPAWVKLEFVHADINDLPLPGTDYDIAVCVSGVHHVVELAAFFARVRDALAPDGELWLIGEAIGPAGNRLDEDALAAGNRLFTQLPPQFRRNAQSAKVDTALRNSDCSEASFEGIRSHQIETELMRFFRAEHVSRRNCILWRWVGPDYVLNYDIQDTSHREILELMVEAEISYHLSGGRPTELHGIYLPLRENERRAD